ncbi:MAG: SurA N-terminal domain-containing protein [Desulfobulbus sp.]|jgi:peptidyl-prolyl cis-trans isomerase D|uniref:peptidylprolyl isomerase n=1 Tax=Desulfobulbus sp. TaxID=895 RepID=UPI00284101FA|nr:SurA N-terminal domain-containing protein [Desulfobulbus sp.]MDR2550599.1 SurA N-terminal domain-containing protein [Desulfobulbus sp.]
MLNVLRKNAQSVVVQAMVVIIALVFIFWGVGGKMKDNPNALAVVNGKEIPYRDFQQSYERTVETYKQQFGGQLPPGLLQGAELKEQVLDRLVQEELLRQGAEKAGILISKESVQRKIQEMTVFNVNGRFDLANYKAVLEQNRLSPSSFEAGIRNDLLTTRALKAIDSFTVVPEQEVVNWIDYIEQDIKLAYGSVQSDDYIDQVQVADDALAAWYETAKNKYKTAPQRKLLYLAFPFEDDLKQVTVNEEAIKTYYQEHAAAYNMPEKRRARHILFRVTAEDSPETKNAKKAQADKVLARIRAGEDFVKLAGQFSEDVTKDKGGDLGFFARGQMVQPFEDSVFALKKGEVSDVVETPFGFHLVKLEEIVPAKTQTLAEATPSIRKALEQKGVKAITFKEASSAYEAIIRAGSVAKYSETSGARPVLKTDFFTQEAPPAAGMAKDPAFVQAAFGLRKGELSSLVETASGYAILFVEDAKDSVVPELAAVRDRAIADYKKEKSVDLARAAAEELLNKAQEQKTWPASLPRKESDYLNRSGATGDLPENIRQDAFSRVGRDVFPEKTIAVGTAFYLYQILDSRQGKGDMDAAKRRLLEQQLHEVEKNILMADWLGQLRKEAYIWTNARMLQ